MATVSAVPHTYNAESLEGRAQQLVSSLQAQDFSAAESMLQQLTADQTLTRGGSLMTPLVIKYVFSGRVTPASKEQIITELLPNLDKWIEQDPNSAYAYAIRGDAYYALAWIARGPRYVSRTPQAAREAYQEQLRKSANDWQTSLQLDSENPIALLGIVTLSRNIGVSPAEVEPYFAHAIQVYPHFFQVYKEKAASLEPKWGGNERELMRFVHSAAAAAPRGTAIPLIVIYARESLCRSSSVAASREYYNREEVWHDIETNYMRVIEDFPESGWYPFWFAEMAIKAGRYELAEQYFKLAQEREPNHPYLSQKIRQYR